MRSEPAETARPSASLKLRRVALAVCVPARAAARPSQGGTRCAPRQWRHARTQSQPQSPEGCLGCTRPCRRNGTVVAADEHRDLHERNARLKRRKVDWPCAILPTATARPSRRWSTAGRSQRRLARPNAGLKLRKVALAVCVTAVSSGTAVAAEERRAIGQQRPARTQRQPQAPEGCIVRGRSSRLQRQAVARRSTVWSETA